MHVLLHHAYIDAWCPIWPNLAASAICSGIVYARLRAHQLAHHEALKQHITDTLGGKNGV